MVNARQLLTSAIILLMIGATALGCLTPVDERLNEGDVTLDTESRQTADELIGDACQGLTFEDMFEYSYALFTVDINQDYASAQVRAVAYINNSLSDQVRFDLDDLIGTVGAPGGSNGYLSNQEENMILEVTDDCIVETNPRFGFRTGEPHRGGEGVDWKNASWINDESNPLQLEYWNLFPPHHPDNRSCPPQSRLSATGECYEVPVAPSDAATTRNCDTTDVTSPDECQIIVWLNGTMTWAADLANADSFTIAMNTTNMTNAELIMNFPEKNSDDGDPLRVSLFEECDGRVVQHEVHQGSTPPVGGCTGDGTITEVVTENADGSLTVEVLTDFDKTEWPVGQDMFADFTNQPPPPNDPPQWTAAAPADGDMIPVPPSMTVDFLSIVNQGLWLTDEAGFSAIDLSCTRYSGDWTIAEATDGAWQVTTNEQQASSVECTPSDIDDNGTARAGDTRMFHLFTPFTMSFNTDIQASHVFTIDPADNAPNMDVTVTLFQDAGVASSTETVTGGLISINLDTSSLSPGEVQLRVHATGTGMSDYHYTYDTILTKESQPPSITISSAEFDGSMWQVTGVFSDPDGEAVTFTIEIDGAAGGEISTSGNTWSSQQINFDIFSEGEHTVTITACDESNVCSTITETVDNSFLFGSNNIIEPPLISTDPVEDSGSLPAPGIGFLVVAVIGALMYAGRRD
ncbi:MAG: hypothetical protein DBX05_01940 [Candidatus Poseidoniales archaeon]|nr:MAG: hypothetical protein DBX05_01940 [Candidatus Poseidoniales archaeon]|tara:strand:+ start:6529 stop:8595 length:2067 start_codon:yes stop_codon:yes gene_type:complete